MGVPFCKENKIHLAMYDDTISIKGHAISYGCKPDSLQHDVYSVNTMILRNDQSTGVYPGDCIEVSSEKLEGRDDREGGYQVQESGRKSNVVQCPEQI